ncbi:CRISPR-associated endoribonuclease Cas2 [compost metagenome]
MRILVFFDLPTKTSKDIKIYSKFRKSLIKDGFIMMQESVYSKLTLNNSVTNAVRARIQKNRPPKGIVQILVITENQYSSMEYIVGEKMYENLDSTERLVII